MMKTFSSQARLLILFGLSLCVGLAFNYLFYDKLPGISFPIFIVLVILSIWLVSSQWSLPVPKSAAAAALAALFFASMLAIRANLFLGFLNAVFSLYLLGIAVVTAAGGFRWERLGSFVRLIGLPFSFLGRVPWSIARFTELRSAGGNKASQQVLRGVLMALPVLLLFILLFASADLVIRSHLMRIFEIENMPQALGRTILVLAISVLAVGMFGYVLSRAAKETNDNADAARALSGKVSSKASVIQISVFLGTIALLFLAFISLQAVYFFGRDAALASQGFTYAEYARRGFFELLAVAVITFVLLWGSERSVARASDRHSRLFKGVAGVLVSETLLIISSAFLRLRLYEAAFGFTTLRLWSHAFTVWLVIGFALFTWKIVKDRGDKEFLVSAFVSLAFALAAMNILNPDAFIARKNIEQFSSEERFDVQYITNLSDDAVPQVLVAFDKAGTSQKAALGAALAERNRLLLNPEEEYHWQSTNWARRRAEALLVTKTSELEGY